MALTLRRRQVPSLPNIVLYSEAGERHFLGQPVEEGGFGGPFFVLPVAPPLFKVKGRAVVRLRRIGKRICIGLEDDLWLVLHLMIAGRLHWKKRGVEVSPPRGLAAFDFANGSLLWTEAGSRKRASLHPVAGEAGGRAPGSGRGDGP